MPAHPFYHSARQLVAITRDCRDDLQSFISDTSCARAPLRRSLNALCTITEQSLAPTNQDLRALSPSNLFPCVLCRCVRLNNHEHTDIAEYIGTYAAGPDGGITFVEGALVTAVRKGHWIVLDELNLAPSDVLEALNRLLDDNRELYVPELQQTVRLHPATGGMDLLSGGYFGACACDETEPSSATSGRCASSQW